MRPAELFKAHVWGTALRITCGPPLSTTTSPKPEALHVAAKRSLRSEEPRRCPRQFAPQKGRWEWHLGSCGFLGALFALQGRYNIDFDSKLTRQEHVPCFPPPHLPSTQLLFLRDCSASPVHFQKGLFARFFSPLILYTPLPSAPANTKEEMTLICS